MKQDDKTISKHWAVTPEPNSGCWLWTGSVRQDGYPQVSFNGRVRPAHRVSWQLENGPVPVGLFVLHKCNNPNCVNPDHLEVGTQKRNMEYKNECGRQVRGEKHHNAVLRDEDVVEIKKFLAAGWQQKVMAIAFEVHVMTINNIKSGKIWGHL